ncbi:hypothetical protein ACH35V_18905 [Actinomadura sp. 1N219]|uniref:hypothetical protein n=1 Tax=Actinomadura sp. 1N219 TaxID=3375152 RepID=UPI0037BD10FF
MALADALHRAVDECTDPVGWWTAVYSDAFIVTQVDDGSGGPAAGTGEATSSLSSPGAVAPARGFEGVLTSDRKAGVLPYTLT